MSLIRGVRAWMALVVVVACVAVASSAIAASGAQASEWKINSGGFKTLAELAQTSEAVNASVAPKTASLPTKGGAENNGKFIFTLTIAGKALKLEATGLSSTEGLILADGKDSGKLVFSGVTVAEPTGCLVKEGKVSTVALSSELVTVSGVLYDKFVPTSGTTFANVIITGCAAAETYPIKGTVYAQSEPLNTPKAAQPLWLSPSINTNGGGSLSGGSIAATLTGIGLNTLSGSHAGAEFKAE